MHFRQITLRELITLGFSLSVATVAQVACATIVGMNTGITTDNELNVTSITVPGGKAFPTPLSSLTADTAGLFGKTANTGGEIVETVDGALGNGTAHNLNLNLPAGKGLAFNGYGYADLTRFGGQELVSARDDNAEYQDFVLADYGANDDFSVAAILSDGSVGARVFVDSDLFLSSQYNDPNTGSFFSQRHGFIAFDITDLKDSSGVNLPPTAVIRGVRVFETQEDSSTLNQRLDLVLFVADVVNVPEPSGPLLFGLSVISSFLLRSVRK